MRWCGPALAAAAGLWACGDPLVSRSYVGAAVYELEGTFQPAEGFDHAVDPATLRLGVFFAGYDTRGALSNIIEHRVEVDTAFTRFVLRIFDEPAAEALTFSPLTEDADNALGLGILVVYADLNGNGILETGGPEGEGVDLVVGAGGRDVIVYLRRPIAGATQAVELLGEIGAGYHLYRTREAAGCRFFESSACEGFGGVTRVVDGSLPTVTLFNRPEDVLVPAPALPSSGTFRRTLWSHRE